jgi:hypothetical protein
MSNNESENKKLCFDKTMCEIIVTIIGYAILIIGSVLLIKTESDDTYKKKSLDVIYTNYENGICSFEKYCFPIKYDNGCRNYYTEDNENNFDCSYLNVVLGENGTSKVACIIKQYELGFYYPEFGDVWYNSTYMKYYNIVYVGDKINVWYDKTKGECKFDYNQYNYASSIILIVFGLIITLSNCGSIRRKKNRIHDEHYNKKPTNFVNVERV